jgi:hypothetical protein
VRRRGTQGQVAAEFALLCAVLAGALWLPWDGQVPVALQWFRAWAEWRASTLRWLADG